jgi:YgiT-type zinc finger domain-containing protein
MLGLKQKRDKMKCPVCKLGTTKIGKSTLTVDIKGHLFFFKDVPSSVCNNCGEVYYSSAVSKQVYQAALESIKKGSEFEIIRLPKVA